MLFPDHPIVDLYGAKSEVEQLKINWSAIGSVSIEDAKKFREELDDQIAKAEKIQAEREAKLAEKAAIDALRDQLINKDLHWTEVARIRQEIKLFENAETVKKMVEAVGTEAAHEIFKLQREIGQLEEFSKKFN